MSSPNSRKSSEDEGALDKIKSGQTTGAQSIKSNKTGRSVKGKEEDAQSVKSNKTGRSVKGKEEDDEPPPTNSGRKSVHYSAMSIATSSGKALFNNESFIKENELDEAQSLIRLNQPPPTDTPPSTPSTPPPVPPRQSKPGSDSMTEVLSTRGPPPDSQTSFGLEHPPGYNQVDTGVGSAIIEDGDENKPTTSPSGALSTLSGGEMGIGAPTTAASEITDPPTETKEDKLWIAKLEQFAVKFFNKIFRRVELERKLRAAVKPPGSCKTGARINPQFAFPPGAPLEAQWGEEASSEPGAHESPEEEAELAEELNAMLDELAEVIKTVSPGYIAQITPVFGTLVQLKSNDFRQTDNRDIFHKTDDYEALVNCESHICLNSVTERVETLVEFINGVEEDSKSLRKFPRILTRCYSTESKVCQEICEVFSDEQFQTVNIKKMCKQKPKQPERPPWRLAFKRGHECSYPGKMDPPDKCCPPNSKCMPQRCGGDADGGFREDFQQPRRMGATAPGYGIRELDSFRRNVPIFIRKIASGLSDMSANTALKVCDRDRLLRICEKNVGCPSGIMRGYSTRAMVTQTTSYTTPSGTYLHHNRSYTDHHGIRRDEHLCLTASKPSVRGVPRCGDSARPTSTPTHNVAKHKRELTPSKPKHGHHHKATCTPRNKPSVPGMQRCDQQMKKRLVCVRKSHADVKGVKKCPESKRGSEEPPCTHKSEPGIEGVPVCYDKEVCRRRSVASTGSGMPVCVSSPPTPQSPLSEGEDEPPPAPEEFSDDPNSPRFSRQTSRKNDGRKSGDSHRSSSSKGSPTGEMLSSKDPSIKSKSESKSRPKTGSDSPHSSDRSTTYKGTPSRSELSSSGRPHDNDNNNFNSSPNRGTTPTLSELSLDSSGGSESDGSGNKKKKSKKSFPGKPKPGQDYQSPFKFQKIKPPEIPCDVAMAELPDCHPLKTPYPPQFRYDEVRLQRYMQHCELLKNICKNKGQENQCFTPKPPEMPWSQKHPFPPPDACSLPPLFPGQKMGCSTGLSNGNCYYPHNPNGAGIMKGPPGRSPEDCFFDCGGLCPMGLLGETCPPRGPPPYAKLKKKKKQDEVFNFEYITVKREKTATAAVEKDHCDLFKERLQDRKNAECGIGAPSPTDYCGMISPDGGPIPSDEIARFLLRKDVQLVKEQKVDVIKKHTELGPERLVTQMETYYTKTPDGKITAQMNEPINNENDNPYDFSAIPTDQWLREETDKELKKAHKGSKFTDDCPRLRTDWEKEFKEFASSCNRPKTKPKAQHAKPPLPGFLPCPLPDTTPLMCKVPTSGSGKIVCQAIPFPMGNKMATGPRGVCPLQMQHQLMPVGGPGGIFAASPPPGYGGYVQQHQFIQVAPFMPTPPKPEPEPPQPQVSESQNRDQNLDQLSQPQVSKSQKDQSLDQFSQPRVSNSQKQDQSMDQFSQPRVSNSQKQDQSLNQFSQPRVSNSQKQDHSLNRFSQPQTSNSQKQDPSLNQFSQPRVSNSQKQDQSLNQFSQPHVSKSQNQDPDQENNDNEQEMPPAPNEYQLDLSQIPPPPTPPYGIDGEQAQVQQQDYPYMCEIRYHEPIHGSIYGRVVTRKQPCRLIDPQNGMPPDRSEECPVIMETPFFNPSCPVKKHKSKHKSKK